MWKPTDFQLRSESNDFTRCKHLFSHVDKTDRFFNSFTQHGTHFVLRVRASDAAESQKVVEMGRRRGQILGGVHAFHVRGQNGAEEQRLALPTDDY